MPEKEFFGSRFAVTEKLIFRHVNYGLHVGNLKIQDRYPLITTLFLARRSSKVSHASCSILVTHLGSRLK